MRIHCEMKECDDYIEYPNIVNETEDSWTDLAYFLTQNDWRIMHNDEVPSVFFYCGNHEWDNDND